jgi:hypothetical protein
MNFFLPLAAVLQVSPYHWLMSGMYVLDAFLMYVRSVRKNEKKGHES